jgi:hypothetical protein
MAPTVPDKRKCLVCDKEFTTVDYAFHIQEEILSQLMVMNETLADIKEITDMTYEYMNTDDNNEPVNNKSSADDKFEEDEDLDNIDNPDNKPVIDSYGDVELENQNTPKNESPVISRTNDSSDTTIPHDTNTVSNALVTPSNPVVGEIKTNGEELITERATVSVTNTVSDHAKSKESDKLENVTLDDILKRIMDR